MVFYHFYDDARKNSLSGHKKQILSLCLLLDCPRFSSVAPLSVFFSTAAHFPFPLPIYIFFSAFGLPRRNPSSQWCNQSKCATIESNCSNLGFELNGAHCTLVFNYNSHYRVIIGCLHLCISWQPVRLCRWFSATTAGVRERTWPREDLNCGTSVHKKHKERCSRGAAPPLAYLCDFFVDAESLYFYWLWRSDGRGPLEYEARLSGLAEAAQPAPAFTLTRAAPGL